MVKVGTIAVDGTKLNANASREQNADFDQIAREILKEAAEVAAEDELPLMALSFRACCRPPAGSPLSRLSSIRVALAARRQEIERAASGWCEGRRASRSGTQPTAGVQAPIAKSARKR
ncbi:MAG TPA: hypothetical protein VKG82_11320 [Solirubrobacteraceae bacterium]|nr:hypothetical protein [Solirubrobacteraceae bacterium]